MSHSEQTIFGEEWWKTVPFALAPSPKTPSDYLVDSMADIAALLGDAKRTQSMVWESPTTEFEYRARAILHCLFSWRWSWLARNPYGVVEADATNTQAFGTVLRYARPQLMYEIWLCNALVILILAFLRPLDVREPSSTRSTGTLWKPSGLLNVQQAAVEICRSLEYQLQNLSAPAPDHQWAMPLALAYVTLPNNEPIAKWVFATIQAAPENRRMPWLCYINRLEGNDQDAASDLFARWPIARRSTWDYDDRRGMPSVSS